MDYFKYYICCLNDNIGKKKEFNELLGDVYFLNKKVTCSSKKKKVLLFSHEMGRTGAPIVLFDTAKILKELGYFVVFISPENGDLVSDIINSNIPVIIDKRLKDIEFDLNKTNDKTVLDDLINYFDFSIFNTLVLFNFINHFKDTNNRIIWWIHEGTTIVDIPWLQKLLPKTVGKNIETYCVSEYSSSILKSRGFDYNQKIMPYGVKEIRIKEKSNIINDNSKKKFVCVGTFNERKGQKYLIDAIESSPTKINNNVEYYFVGDATDEYGKNQIERLDTLIKNNNFIFRYSSMKREELLKLFNSVDGIIIPSVDDPLPVVATECMMLKKIVLCSDGTGTSSFIKNGISGFIFEKASSSSLIDTLDIFLKNDNKNIINSSYSIYKKYFDLSIFKKNICTYFIKGK